MICCFSASGFSQEEPDPAQAKMELAVKSASASFEAGQFRAAAKKFAEAFGHLKDYNLKKNEMVSWFKAGDCAAAIDAGQLYLSGNGDITKFDRGDVKTVNVRCLLIAATKFLNLGRLEKCEVQLNEAEALIGSDGYSPVIGSDESREIQGIRDQISAIKTRETPNDEPTSASIAGPVMAISGGVVAVGGGILLLLSKSKESEFTCSKNVDLPSCDNPTTVLTESEFADAKSAANVLSTMGWVGVAGGVALSSVGIYLWTTRDSGPSETAKLYIDPSRKNVGVQFTF